MGVSASQCCRPERFRGDAAYEATDEPTKICGDETLAVQPENVSETQKLGLLLQQVEALLSELGADDTDISDDFELRCEFDACDTGDDGALPEEQVWDVFNKLGMTTFPRMVCIIVHVLDAADDIGVKWADVVKIHRISKKWGDTLEELGKRSARHIAESTLRRLFAESDAEKKQSIGLAQLAKAFESTGIAVDGATLRTLVKLAAQTEEDGVDITEFLKIFAVINGAADAAKSAVPKVAPGPSTAEAQVVPLGSRNTASLEWLTLVRQISSESLQAADNSSMVTSFASSFDASFNPSDAKDFVRQISEMPVDTPELAPEEHDVEHHAATWAQIARKSARANPFRRGSVLDKTHLLERFREMDTSGDGSLDHIELTHFLQSLGMVVDEPRVKDMIRVADTDGNGTIEWSEFHSMFTISMQWYELLDEIGGCLGNVGGTLSDAQLRRQFVLIDRDKNGVLDVAELRLAFSNLNIKMSEKTLAKLIYIADTNGSGFVEWPEFRNLFRILDDAAKRKKQLLASA